MVLNKFMHPKNLYKKKQPSFKELALKYEEFRKHTTQDEAGKVHLDFKDPKALKALTWVLLKDDFDLDVDLPLDRLIPTVPLRLNYILWLSDIVGKKKSVRGIDIGCGASCVYPLLGANKFKWTFLATESDDLNYEFARRNVVKNSLGERITVAKVEDGDDIITGLDDGGKYDFTMCNPPFFKSNLEAYAMTKTRNPDRPEPSSVCTASESEAITPGGEVEFVKKMIKESHQLKDRIRVFTTMLGIKSSVGVLKEELRKQGIRNVGSYEFCQGKTMRWGLGWSFDHKVLFPKSPFQLSKTPEKGPLIHMIPRDSDSCEYDIKKLGVWLTELLDEVNVKFHVIMDCEAMWSATVTAHQNTWANQRRKRRAEKRAELANAAKRHSPDAASSERDAGDKAGVSEDPDKASNRDVTEAEKSSVAESEKAEVTEEGKPAAILEPIGDIAIANEVSDTNDCKSEASSQITENTEFGGSESVSTDHISECLSTHDPELHDQANNNDQTKKKKTKSEPLPLFSAWFTFKFDEGEQIYLEMKWIKGTDREALHQVMQLAKNRLKTNSR